MGDCELAVIIMHDIELAFELKPQLNFFLMVRRLLHVLFF